ncbi:O-antigen ligase family protein [Aliarcobacter butzleri]|uniref:O-antigen ligase family protein n=1 Tax=Aliarcobacter butzleri TaxID=28197 RepID=UPI00263C012F|nr:O-antigen ligase family protein [Aliarcobacter butzleri]MDN5130958.1 O-antigen ligase family protein [Aliarcobacter butzleri]
MTEYFRNIKQDYFKIYMFTYIFLLPWNFFSGFFSNLTIILFIWWMFIAKKKGYFIKVKDIFINKPLVIFYLFIIYALLSLLWSDNIKVGIKELEYYKYYPIITLVFFSSFNKEDIKMAFYIITFTFGLYALFSLSIYFEIFTIVKDGVIKSDKSDPKGILPYVSVVFYMALNVFLTVYFFINEKSLKLRYAFIFIASISFLTIIVNNSRMGQLGFIGTILILMIYYRQYLFRYKKILITLFLTLALSICFLYINNKIDRYSKGVNELVYSYQNNKYIGSWGPRLFFYKAAFELIPKNLIFGAGIGDAVVEFMQYQEANKNIVPGRTYKDYHNEYLNLLSKFGIVGTLLFFVSIFFLLRELYIKNKYFLYIGLVFFSLFFFNCIGGGMLRANTFNNFFMLTFVLLSLTLKEEKDNL